MSHNITVEGGTSVRLPTAGKYCDRDIIITAEGGTPTPTQEKTIEIMANGTVEVTPDEGYALSKVTANVSVPIPDGYIKPSGTIEVTENGEHDVTEYASVSVNVSGGGFSVDDIAQKNISGDITITVDSIAKSAFESCPISSVTAPNLVTISNYAFGSTGLVTADFPSATTVGPYSFQYCVSLERIRLPVCTQIQRNAFQQDTVLNMVDLPRVTSIALYAFYWCRYLDTVILRSPSVVSLGNSNAFLNAGANIEKLYIYVPSTLLESYKNATNWSTYADNFRAIEDYPEITGG